MMKKKAQSLGDEFAANLQRALAAAPEAVDATTPASAAAAAPMRHCAGGRCDAWPVRRRRASSRQLVAALRAVAARPLRTGLAGTLMSAVQQGMLWPRTVDEATAMLAADPEARPLAGGATLVAMMNARVLEPQRSSISRASTSCAASAARPTAACASAPSRATRETAACALLRGPAAVVRQAASKIANATVRNMGTIGGSISFADPGLDYPPALVAADASVEIAGPSGRRRMPARRLLRRLVHHRARAGRDRHRRPPRRRDLGGAGVT